jgi:hypothetical protein
MCPQTPASKRSHSGEYDTPKRMRFFEAFDAARGHASIRSIALKKGVNPRTAQHWVRARAIHGSPAQRRTRKLSDKLGRPRKLKPEIVRGLVSPSKNEYRRQPLEVQIEKHQLNVAPRTLQRNLKEDTKNAQMYKARYTKKEITSEQAKKRHQFGEDHIHHTVENFYQFVVYTDEAHADPSSQLQDRVLREAGTATEPENLQQRPPKTGNTLHFAGWSSYHSICEELIFYNDEQKEIVKPKRPLKPIRSKYEDDSQWQYRLDEWAASETHEKVMVPKGNSMTQKYYVEKILPVYIEAVKTLQTEYPGDWLLQEDGDPSHGLKKRGLAYKLKQAHGIKNLEHPPNSPDLNPHEGLWNILKQRVRKLTWESDSEGQRLIQAEWKKITLEQARRRIDELPARAKQLLTHPDQPIKGNRW